MVRRMVWFMVIVVVMVGIAPVHAQDAAAYRNRVAVREALAEFSAGNVDGLVQLFADPFKMNEAEPTLVEATPQALTPFLNALKAAIPNLHIVPKVMIAQGDWVVMALSSTGTFSQPFSFAPFGSEAFPPTNQRVSWTEMDFLRFNEEGKVIEQWVMGDSTAMFSALGLLPPTDEVNQSGTPLAQPAGYQRLNADALAATYTSGREAETAALFREQVELIDQGADTSGYYTEPYVSWEAGIPSAVSASEDQQFHQALKAAMPDFAVSPDVVVAQGDWVAGLVTITGTFANELHIEELGALQPTGQSMVWQLGVLQRYDGHGKVVEEWVETDFSSVAIALGLMPMEEGG